MTRLRKALCILSCLLLVTLPMSAWASPENITSETAKTTARLEVWKAIQAGRMGSATVAVMDNGRIVYAEGFGAADRAQGIPVDRNTVFNIGSISKTYCATAIMLLVDEGKVNLDKPVTAYIPEFTMADERYRDITVRMLLNHSSGLPGGNYANSFGFQYHDAFLSETLAALSKSHLKHRPGERAVYCNDGFTLAEIIVERVSGQKYSRFLADRIFAPLSLHRTHLSVGHRPDASQQVFARYYDSKSRLEPLEVIAFLGSGGLSATAEDLCRFADTFSPTGKHLLSSASLAEMRRNQPPEFWDKLRKPMISLGLGWDFTELPNYKLQGLQVLGKSGGTGHYSSMLYTLPDHRISVAVIGAFPGAPSQDIALAVLDAYATEKGLFKAERKPVSVPRKPMPLPGEGQAYEGYYAGDGGSVVKMILDSEKNTLTILKIDGEEEKPLQSAIYNADYFHDATGQKFYFATVDQQKYFVAASKIDFILFQKIESLSEPQSLLPDVAGKQWLRRNAKAYEGTMSTAGHIETPHLIKQLPGYVDFAGIKKITSPTSAGVFLPSMRDSSELQLFEKDSRLWAWVSGLIYMPADLASTLGTYGGSVNIGDAEFNEWRKIPRNSILSFRKSGKGRLILYDATGTVLYDNVLNSGSIFAPEGAFIEMAGETGDTFIVNLASVPE